ncbi:MAG: hypothetical protein IKM53_01740 [Clostridia bacterium]|nr:hypothetical protein [Clostridia bacterium]
MKTTRFLWQSLKYNLNAIGVGNKFKSSSTGKKIAFSLLFAFLLLYLVGMSVGLSYIVADFLSPLGLIDMLPLIFFVLVSILMLVTSVFSSQSYLYKAKDVEMLSALPLSNRVILVSKVLAMYVYDLIFAFIFLVPSSVFYFIYADFSVIGLLSAIVIILLSPILPSALGMALSYFVGRTIKHIKYKNVFITLLSLAVFFGYQYLVSHLGTVVEYFQNNAYELHGQISRYYPPARLFSDGLSGKLLSTLLFAVISIALGVLLILLIAPHYSRICANFKQTAKGKKFAFQDAKSDSNKKPISTLTATYKKELYRFFSSSTYFLNTGILFLLISILFFASLFTERAFLVQVLNLPFATDFLTPLMCAMLCVGIGSVYTTAVSISVEGNKLWIYKSMPIKEQTVFLAKILVSLTVTLPVLLVDAFVLFIGLELEPRDLVLLVTVPAVYAVFTAVGGLLVNLMLPKLDYPNEIIAVKQSAPAFIGMFGGITLPILVGALAYLLKVKNLVLFLCIAAGIFAALTLLFVQLLRTWGVKRFRSL